MKTPLAFLAGLLALSSAALAQNRLAYGANIGWIDFAPDAGASVHVGESFLSGHAHSANCGWIHFGDTPDNGVSYANIRPPDIGVNHDGCGTLSGFAYGANIGWINFGWTADNSDPNRPWFDLTTGQFHGFAYSANCGWINLGAGYLAIDRIEHPDADGDGIDDIWEHKWFGDLTTAGVGTDADGDGQSDAAEYAADTDPLQASDFLRIVSHSYANGHTEVTLVFTTQPSRLYQLQHSTDLVTWSDSGLGTFAPDPDGKTTRTFSFSGTARHFFRACAVLPLTP